MKKVYFILTIGLLLFSYSCQEDYLEVENKNDLTVDNFYKTGNDYLLALNSCYCALMDAGLYGRIYAFLYGTFEDRILFETKGLDEFAINSRTGHVEEVWRGVYFGIYRTSMLIKKILENPEIEGLTENERRYYLAQARAIRASSYWHAVILFDKPVFYEENNIPVNYMEDLTNGTPEQFWSQMEEDLTLAIPDLKLKSELSDDEIGRVTKGGARALLGKAMLFKYYYYYARNGKKGQATGDLETAKKQFTDLMNSGEYELIMPLAPKTRKDYLYALLSNSSYIDLPSENNLYPAENNKESVWEVQFSSMMTGDTWYPGWKAAGSTNGQYYGPHISSFKNHEAHPALYYEYETEGVPDGFDRDPRTYATFYIDGDTMDFRPESAYYKSFSLVNYKKIAQTRKLNVPEGTFGLGIKKYYFPVYDGPKGPRHDPTNRRIIRYADVLLMYAEVMLLLGDDGTGLQALNQVRSRVDMPPVSELTREAIIHERDVELAFEFHRFVDLVRWSFDPSWNIDWGEIYGPGIFVKGKNEFLPIPLTEIDLHQGKLKQNPGW